MRFYAHDGKTTHGPSDIAELVRLKGFDGDTLVCPVGSSDSADWKPALAYPAFKEFLLKAPPPTVVTPAPVPPPTQPLLPDAAPFAPVRAEPLPTLRLEPQPPVPDLNIKPVNPPIFTPAPAPVTIPCPKCAHANPTGSRFCNMCAARIDGTVEDEHPTQIMRKQPVIGKMGQLAAFEAEQFIEPQPTPAPTPLPEAPPQPPPKSKMLLRALVLITAIGIIAAAAWNIVRPMKWSSSREKLSVSEKSIENTVPVTEPAIALASTTVAQTAPSPKAVPVPPVAPIKLSPRPQTARSQMDGKAKPRRSAKPKRRAAQKKSITTETGEAPAQKPTSANPLIASLPGVGPEPVAQSTSTATAEESGDQLALLQVREQFDFCAQLLYQGAYGDHFDTCLCKDTRNSAPYKGNREAYIKIRKSEDDSGTTYSRASILNSKLDGNTAILSTNWEMKNDREGKLINQIWQLEDGLWCLTRH